MYGLESESSSQRFQDGLFTAFYTVKKGGLSQEIIFRILEAWENNNKTNNEDFMNLKNNYIKFCDELESIEDIFQK
jgi:hypothetical protein